MTATTRKLGRRQVDVLRAAAKRHGLARFDDGGWAAGSQSCTPAAESVAKREPGLLMEGDRMALFTLGSGKTRRGVWMGLSAEGRAVLDAYDAAHPEDLVARQRRADAIARLAAKRGPITGDDLLRLAANDEQVSDDTFTILGRAVDGRPITDYEE